MNDDIFEKTT